MIKMLFDNVLILPSDAVKQTAGGIYIPSTSKEKPITGKVIEVGEGLKDEPMLLKKDDVVFFDKYSGTEFEMNGISHLILKQNNIFCVIE